MYRRNAVLIICLALILVVRSDETLRCYMCTSETTPGCGTDPKAYNIEPEECTVTRMRDWQQRIVKQHNILRPIESIFEVDDSKYSPVAVPMACAKMILKVNKREVVVRNCQMAKTDTIDPCKAIEGKGKLIGDPIMSVEHCDLCESDACNSSDAFSPRILFTLSSILAAVAIANLYNTA
ncbi:uncharacterized protein LOC108622885 [Ceratina calcarata]|uniref:Uncharacterized protein LOC108622885 n=1 Tax=Ceratina calcarata TaxID=156304 RepID=A0AAJ7ITS2_9HYME|nr:uncharacterized protein LOC108622885 [Ceratina calcarata]